MCAGAVDTGALTGADPSSSGGGESSVGGGFTSVTVALSVCLSVTVSVLVVVVVVGVVRRLRASTSTHHAAAATPGGVPAPHTRGSLPSWGFDSIRSKFSATSEAADDDQLSY